MIINNYRAVYNSQDIACGSAKGVKFTNELIDKKTPVWRMLELARQGRIDVTKDEYIKHVAPNAEKAASESPFAGVKKNWQEFAEILTGKK
jgi:hypothetical protein